MKEQGKCAKEDVERRYACKCGKTFKSAVGYTGHISARICRTPGEPLKKGRPKEANSVRSVRKALRKSREFASLSREAKLKTNYGKAF